MATAPVATKPKIPPKVPALSPFVLHLLLCPTCSEVVIPTLTRLQSGRVTGIAYYHCNEEYGCGWVVRDFVQYAAGQTLGLRESIQDGVGSDGRPKFINEYELAADTSFPLASLRHVMPPVGETVAPAEASAASEAVAELDAALSPKTAKPKPYSARRPHAADRGGNVSD